MIDSLYYCPSAYLISETGPLNGCISALGVTCALHKMLFGWSN